MPVTPLRILFWRSGRRWHVVAFLSFTATVYVILWNTTSIGVALFVNLSQDIALAFVGSVR